MSPTGNRTRDSRIFARLADHYTNEAKTVAEEKSKYNFSKMKEMYSILDYLLLLLLSLDALIMLTRMWAPRRTLDIMPKTPTSAPVLPVHPKCWPRPVSLFANMFFWQFVNFASFLDVALHRREGTV